MAKTGSITIPVILDDTALKSSLQNVSNLLDKSFNDIVSKVNGLNKKSIFTLNTKDLDKSVNDIEAKLKRITEAKEINIKKPRTADAEKQLALLETRLKSLTAQKTVIVSIKEANTTSLKDINSKIENLTKQKNEIILSGDTKDLKNKLGNIDSQLEGLEKVRNIKLSLDKQRLNTLNAQLNSLGKIGAVALAGLGAALGSAGVAMFKLGTSASDAEEITNKLINTFSNLDDAMTSNAVSDLTTNYGLAKVSAEELLATTGDLLVGFGITEDKALSLSLQAQKLAVDLASYQNKDVVSVSHALTSAFIGEREALKSLGIAIDEETIKERLLAEGKNKLTGMARKQAEAEITLAIAMKQSSKAIGDYERTSNGFANQQRLIGENLKELSVTLGQNFLPAITDLTIYTNKAIEEFALMLTTNEELKTSLAEASTTIANFGKALVDWVIEILPKAIDGLAWIIDNSGALMAAIVAIAGTFVTLKIAVWAASFGVGGLTAAFASLNIATGGIILAVGLLVTGLAALAIGYKDSGITEATKEIIKQNDALEKEHQALDKNVKSYKQMREETTKLIARYDELGSASVKSADAQAEQEEILNRLKTLYPDLEILYDKNKKAIGYNVDELNELTKAYNLNTKEQIEGNLDLTESAILKNETDKGILEDQYDNLKKQIEKTQKNYDASITGSGNLSSAYSIKLQAENKELERQEENYKAILKEGERLNSLLTKQQSLVDNLNKPETVTPATKTTGGTTAGTGGGGKTADKTLQEKLEEEQKIYNAQVGVNKKLAKNNEDLANRQLETDRDYWNKRLNLYEQEVEKVASVGGVIEETLIAGMKDAETALNDIDFNEFQNELEDLYAAYEKDMGIADTISDEETKRAEQLRIAEQYYDDLLKAEADYIAKMEVDKDTKGSDIVQTSTTEISVIGTEEQIKALDELQIKLAEAQLATAEFGVESENTSQTLAEKWKEAIDDITDGIKEMDDNLENNKGWEKFTEGVEGAFTVAMEVFDTFASGIGDLFSGAVDLSNQLIQNQIDEVTKAYETESEIRDEKYKTDKEALDEKYKTEQDAYAEQLEALDEQSEEHQEQLDEINEEREELEAEKQEIMTEEDYEALQQKIEDKEAQAEEEKALLEAVEAKHKTTLDNQKQAEKDYDAEKKRIDKEYTESKKANDEAYAIKKATLERKQAENSKALSIFDITIAYAKALMLATLAGLAMAILNPFAGLATGIALGAVATAVYGMQLATIISTPLPEIPSFSFGGLVPENNDHLFPQVPKSKYANDRTLAWLSAGEMVLTPGQNEMYQNMQALQLRDTFNNSNYDNSRVTTINNEIIINAKEGMDTKKLAKQVVLQISRGYS